MIIYSTSLSMMIYDISIVTILVATLSLLFLTSYKKIKSRFQKKTRKIVAYNDRLKRQKNALFKFGTHNDLYKGNVYSSIMKLCEITQEALDSSSVSIWYLDEQKMKLCCYEEYVHKKHWGRLPIDLKLEFELLQELESSRIQAHYKNEDLPGRNPIDSLMNPEAESLLFCTLYLDNEFRGVFCIERNTSESWTSDEKAFAASLLDILVTALLISDRKVLEDELFLKSAAVSSTFEGIAILEEDGNILFANKAYAEMHGYQNAIDIKGAKIEQFYDEEEFKRFHQELLPTLCRRGKITVDAKGKTLSGTTYPQELSLSLIHEGKYVLVVRDISVRKRVEQKAQEHALFSTLCPSPILRANPEGMVTLANPAAVRIFGVDQQKYIEEVLPGLSRNDIRRCIRDGSTSTITLQRNDHRFILTLTGLPELQIAHIYAKDITDLQYTENRLKESERFLRTILDAAPSAIFVKDDNGRYTLANQTTAKLFGLPVQNVIGKTDYELCSLPSQAENFRKDDIRVLRENRQILIRREFLTDREGKKHVFQTVKRPLSLGKNNEVTHVLGVGADITESVELHDKLGQSMKMEAIGQLAGGVAHDFNNLLTGILGYAEVLKSENVSSEEVTSIAEKIEHISLRATDLTEKLLGFARKGKHKNVPMKIDSVIDETIEICSRTLDRGISLEYQTHSKEEYIKGDPTQIQQVLLNLVINARDAIRDHHDNQIAGEIAIKTKVVLIDQDNQLHYPQLRPGEYIKISVLDSGAGVSEEIREKIFEPFFTTKDAGKGTGMGLSMVYGIVANHGGAVLLEKDPAFSTVFSVYLPRHIELREISPPRLIDIPEPQTGSGCILLVDDHYIVREVTAKMLNALGYRVMTAGDGIEAVRSYKKYNGEIDLIILDMVMPRMSARECFRMIRKINPHVRVVLSTGYARNNVVQEVMDEGMVGFVQKPFQLSSLSHVVSRALQH